MPLDQAANETCYGSIAKICCQFDLLVIRNLKMTAVGFEPTPLRTGALSQRLRPLGQTVLHMEVALN